MVNEIKNHLIAVRNLLRDNGIKNLHIYIGEDGYILFHNTVTLDTETKLDEMVYDYEEHF